MKKKRIIIFGVIFFIIASTIAAAIGLNYYNDPDKKTLFECIELNPDNIVSLDFDIMDHSYYEAVKTEDKEKIKSIAEYLNKVKVKETEKDFPYETPDKMFHFIDENGIKYSVIINGDVAYTRKEHELSKENYKVYGYSSRKLLKVCKSLGLYED